MDIPVYQVDNSVPIPGKHELPLKELAVGESFLFPITKRYSVATQVSKIKQQTGKVYTIRKQDAESARVWRTK